MDFISALEKMKYINGCSYHGGLWDRGEYHNWKSLK